eukprot:Polyplicarium_translucidae@DN2840_c0_g2_i2.p1
MSASKRHQLSYKGENFLRQRIVLSLLSGRPFRVTGIRENDPLNVGLRPHEETLLEIVMKISDETVVTIDSTGTALQFSPGRLEGGEFSITCRGERALTYYLRCSVGASLAVSCWRYQAAERSTRRINMYQSSSWRVQMNQESARWFCRH